MVTLVMATWIMLSEEEIKLMRVDCWREKEWMSVLRKEMEEVYEESN